MPETPTRHVRGTTLEFHGWVWRDGVPKTDLPADTLILSIADPQTMVPAIVRTTGDAEVRQEADGSWRVVIPAEETRRARLPKDTYWVHVALIDHTTGKEWCVGRGPLTLLPSPRA